MIFSVRYMPRNIQQFCLMIDGYTNLKASKRQHGLPWNESLLFKQEYL